MGVDEWEETRLVLLGELFGTNACAWLTKGTKVAGEWRKVREISTITAFSVATLMAEI